MRGQESIPIAFVAYIVGVSLFTHRASHGADAVILVLGLIVALVGARLASDFRGAAGATLGAIQRGWGRGSLGRMKLWEVRGIGCLLALLSLWLIVPAVQWLQS